MSYKFTYLLLAKKMSLHNQNHKSFIPCQSPKLGQFYSEEFQIQQFSKLSLNSHENSDNRSARSNSSLFIPSIPILVEPRSADTFSMGSRHRKGSVELEWKNSIAGNLTFLNKSLVGKSSLCHHEQFNFHEAYEPYLHKQLSQKSCPVGSDETDNLHSFQKVTKALEQGEIVEFSLGRERLRKKFLKTKNLLRNLSSYLHKYIKYNPRCRKFVIKYFIRKNPDADDLEAQQFYLDFLQWINKCNLTNFQDYQHIWTEQTKFTSIYRQICYKYYREDLFCDVQSSRLSSKEIIQEYIPQFIQGLLNPKTFTHFQNQ